MTMIPPFRKLIQIEGSQFRGAVSEELIQRLGATNNFISLYQHDVKEFRVNGPYSKAPVPFYAVDGIYTFLYDAEILAVTLYNAKGGTSGTTQVDIKYSTAPNAAWSSIFSTLPSISYNAHTTPNDVDKEVWVTSFSSAPANTVAPVLSTTLVNAGWSVRMDLLTSQVDASNAGVIIYFRPR